MLHIKLLSDFSGSYGRCGLFNDAQNDILQLILVDLMVLQYGFHASIIILHITRSAEAYFDNIFITNDSSR